jgi:hypothetical protein
MYLKQPKRTPTWIVYRIQKLSETVSCAIITDSHTELTELKKLMLMFFSVELSLLQAPSSRGFRASVANWGRASLNGGKASSLNSVLKTGISSGKGNQGFQQFHLQNRGDLTCRAGSRCIPGKGILISPAKPFTKKTARGVVNVDSCTINVPFWATHAIFISISTKSSPNPMLGADH